MWSMSAALNRLSVFLLVIVVFYGEFLTYWLHTLSWPRLAPVTDNVTLLLLVADPQIPGLRHEPSGLLGMVRRWDCDRYLSLSYRWVLAILTPSAIVFLGDLIDEASEATSEEQASYAHRFHRIYPPTKGAEMIYLPGDNDIGGEGNKVTEERIAQFEKDYGPTIPRMVSVTPWLTLIPVSRLISNNADKNIKKTGFNLSRTPDQKVVVGLSHWPLLPKHDQLTDTVLAFNPEVIFSGHYHHGGLWRVPRIQKVTLDNQPRNESKGPLLKKPLIFHQAEDKGPIVVDTGSEQLTEVVVPAVSYRMGVPDMAFGVATISRDGAVTYANLWLPKRFSVLRLYFFSALIVCSIFILKKVVEVRRYWGRARPWWDRNDVQLQY